MDCDLKQDGTSLTVWFSGELEFADIEACQPIMAECREAAVQRFVVDLSKLEVIDSSGLGVLISIRNSAVRRDAEFAIKGARGDVAAMLKMARFDALATFEP